MQKTWHTVHGFDTAWVPPNVGMVASNQQENCDSHVYVMYHGTSKQAAVDIQRNGFTPSKVGMLGAGVYLSRDIRKMVLKVKVNVGRVKVINKKGHDMQYNWHTHGFDTAWVPPGVGMVPSNQEEDCVYDPKRIKVMAMLDVANLKK
uniref:PARP catalytic domain-containing protein n=1 Tax=Oncorhynchus mykiss TaxID=8022 RepID=A0A8K9Y0B4_ONCMY